MNRSLSIAFWNVQNLFREGTHDARGPKSPEERDAKLDALAAVIGRLADGSVPDILALAEVAEETLVRDLTRRLTLDIRDPPPVVFEAPQGNDTGLAVIGLTPSIAALSRLAAETRGHRPRALSVKVTLAAGSSPLYVIACHWKSARPMAGHSSPRSDRRRSGIWLSEHLSGNAGPNGKTDPVVVVGDFNAEPYAPEISQALHATRHQVRSVRANGVRLFNSMWPWLVDPGASLIPGQAVNLAPPSLTSFGRGEPQILDQLLVSRSILRVDAFGLGSVDYHRDDDTAELLPQARHVVPKPWSWDTVAGRGAGTSDHFPLVATLLY